jgi:hypothetical protein
VGLPDRHLPSASEPSDPSAWHIRPLSSSIVLVLVLVLVLDSGLPEPRKIEDDDEDENEDD